MKQSNERPPVDAGKALQFAANPAIANPMLVSFGQVSGEGLE